MAASRVFAIVRDDGKFHSVHPGGSGRATIKKTTGRLLTVVCQYRKFHPAHHRFAGLTRSGSKRERVVGPIIDFSERARLEIDKPEPFFAFYTRPTTLDILFNPSG